MTNSYYNPTGSPLDHSAGVSQSMRNEFSLIQAGFQYLSMVVNGFAGAALVTATETGTATAHVLTPSTPITAYTAFMTLMYLPAHSNTGACTVNVSGLGAKNILHINQAVPTSGDIIAGQVLELIYDGTNFINACGFLMRTGNQVLNGNLSITGALGVAGATTLPTATTIGTTTAAELGYVHGVTSAIQAQIDAEIATRTANDNTEIALRTAADLLLAPLTGADFSGAITIQAPTLSTNPATKAYVDLSISSSGVSPAWVSGQTYILGATVYSPIDFKTYRHSTATSSLTTDPFYDGANWNSLSSAIDRVTYDNRAILRTSRGGAISVESLGLFYWVSGSTEPDDDETAFATSTGAWELVAADADYVFASWLASFEALQAAVDDNAAKNLFGSFSMTLTSLSAITASSFTATVLGAVTGDRVIVTPGDAFGTSTTDQSKLSYTAYVSTPNIVTISIRNASATAATMTASTWSILVIKQ